MSRGPVIGFPTLAIARNILNFYPRPNVGRNLFTTTQVQENDNNQFGARIDHRLSSSDQLFLRYLFSQASMLNPLSINGAGPRIGKSPPLVPDRLELELSA